MLQDMSGHEDKSTCKILMVLTTNCQGMKAAFCIQIWALARDWDKVTGAHFRHEWHRERCFAAA
jgi:hypothetical protein